MALNAQCIVCLLVPPSRRGIPLKAVVANCEAKWFLQELQVEQLSWMIPAHCSRHQQRPCNEHTHTSRHAARQSPFLASVPSHHSSGTACIQAVELHRGHNQNTGTQLQPQNCQACQHLTASRFLLPATRSKLCQVTTLLWCESVICCWLATAHGKMKQQQPAG